MSNGVLLISFSAFFADVGYQMVQAIFPIYLVLTLSTNAFYFGAANAVAYGGGALFAYCAGLLGNRYSRKWLAVIGSAFILLMPLVGISINPILAIAFFATGWWARNFRIPPRRSMLTDMSRKENLGKVFGFLHALDISGGLASVIILILLLSISVSQNSILLITAVPLTISVLLLVITSDVRRRRLAQPRPGPSHRIGINRSTYRGIILATALYGFSYYSLGFPILTIARSSNILLGVGSYGVYLGVSAVMGYFIGSRKGLNKIKALGYLGYILSGVGTGILALAYASGSGFWLYYLGVALMGFGLGVVETMEPTIISMLRSAVKLDTGMGALQGSRSFGLFFANLVMGILYVVSPAYSYLYAAIVSLVAGGIVLAAGRGFRG
ncbi:MAG: MFS transporter [Candidatus Micrarchaeota archaeon]|nr:MFS transporter [Candidatus Micrarchaeota archaeon]